MHLLSFKLHRILQSYSLATDRRINTTPSHRSSNGIPHATTDGNYPPHAPKHTQPTQMTVISFCKHAHSVDIHMRVRAGASALSAAHASEATAAGEMRQRQRQRTLALQYAPVASTTTAPTQTHTRLVRCPKPEAYCSLYSP